MINQIKKIFTYMKHLNQKNTCSPGYRVLGISKDQDDNYVSHIQIIGKSATFYSKPEIILSDDKLVSMFSPLDIRTLTYLGYLGINTPKYKILAQRLIDNDKTLFVIKKQGDHNVLLKTADEILKEREIVTQITLDDAKTVGYTAAIENIQNEEKVKDNFKININNSNTGNLK